VRVAESARIEELISILVLTKYRLIKFPHNESLVYSVIIKEKLLAISVYENTTLHRVDKVTASEEFIREEKSLCRYVSETRSDNMSTVNIRMLTKVLTKLREIVVNGCKILVEIEILLDGVRTRKKTIAKLAAEKKK